MKISKSLIYTATLSLLLFIITLLGISFNNSITSLDKSVNILMPIFQNNSLILLSKIINTFFDVKILLIIALIIIIFLLIKKNNKKSIFMATLMLIGTGAIYIIKEIVQRARPLNTLITETGYSFPSGHTTIATIFFGILSYWALNKTHSKKIKIYLILLTSLIILIIGLSRLILNIHWLTDILAGLFLGLTILASGILFKEMLEKNK